MKKSGNTTGVLKRVYFMTFRGLFSLLLLAFGAVELAPAQEQGSSSPQPSQTRAKTFVPSPSSPERAAATGQFKIVDIEFSSKRDDVPINEEKIRQNMRSTKGGVYLQQTVDEDIESLYATGDYANVQIVTSEEVAEDGERGIRLSVIVEPKVRVSEVKVKRKRPDGQLDDQLSVDAEDLLDLKHKALVAGDEKGQQALANAFKKKETVTQAGDVLSEERLSRDAVAMEDFYRDKGFKDVKITPVPSPVEGGEAKVVFEIDEGVRGFISKIRFIGNQEIPTAELEKVLKLKPRAWWQFLSKSDRYEEYAKEDDVARLKNLYLNRGYIDIKIDGTLELSRTARNQAAQTEAQKEENDRPEDFNPDDIPAEELTLTYRIEEGRQYRVGNLTVEGNTFFSSDDLQNELQYRAKMKEIFDQVELKLIRVDGLQPGAVYSVNGLQASIETIQDKYGRRGFREARIETRLQANVETGMMDVNFDIKEGEKFYVDKIIIQGNDVTKDKVIRREIELAPQEVFDSVREKASKKKIEGLGYFGKVETYAEETDLPNRQNLIVQVEEKKTAEFSFQLGMSSVELLTAGITASQANFDLAKVFQSINPSTWKGAGQKARFRANGGFRSQNLSLDFVEPWLFDKPIKLSTSGYYNGASYLSEYYNQQNYGASIGISRQLGDEFPLNRWSVGAEYRPEYFNIFDLQSDAPPYFQASTGDTLKSSLRGRIAYDGRDNINLPRRGQTFEFTAEGAGGPLLGSENIWKMRAEFKTHHLLWEEKDLILMAKAQVGLVDSYSSTEYVPVWDQLFAGGSGSVRGFSPAIFGTVNSGAVGPKQDGQPVGGSTSGTYQVELSAPPPALENMLRVFAFCDGGFVNEDAFDFQPKIYNNTQTMMVNGVQQSYGAVNGGFQIGVGGGIQLMQMIPMKFSFGYPVMTADPNNRGGVKFYLESSFNF